MPLYSCPQKGSSANRFMAFKKRMLQNRNRFTDMENKSMVTTSSVVKESTCNAGDPGSIPGSGRSTGEEIGYPLQYSWASLVAQLVKNLPAVQEIWVQSWVGKIPWRRERLPTPVFWPGECHRLYSPWGCKESDTTERLSLTRQKTSTPDLATFCTIIVDEL